MPGPDYIIRAKLVIDDTDAGRDVDVVDRKVTRLDRKARGLGLSFGRAFAMLGGAAAAVGVARGIASINSEIETAEAGLATLFSAQFGLEIEQGVMAARSSLQGLREDAAKGVGELTDYTRTFQLALGAGVDPDSARELTRNALGAGFALQGQRGLQNAGLDLQQAIQSGVSDRTTPIVMAALNAMGMAASEFNAMDVDSKVRTLNEAFGAFEGGVELMGQTWEAQTATLRDTVTELARTVTRPLFDSWTRGLRRVNDLLDGSSDRLARIATRAGEGLPSLFNAATSPAGIGAAAGAGAVAVTTGLGGAAGIGLFGVVAAGATMVLGALSEFPQLFGMLVRSGLQLWEALGPLADAFARLTGQGSVLNLIGAGMLLFLGGFVRWLSRLVDILTVATDAVGTLFRVAGNNIRAVFEAIRAAMSGDAEGARAVLSDALDRDRRLVTSFGNRTQDLFIDDAGERARRDEQAADLSAMLDGLKSGGNVTNINGPVNVEVKAETLDDPDRVAVAFEDILDRVVRFKQGVRRPGLAPV